MLQFLRMLLAKTIDGASETEALNSVAVQQTMAKQKIIEHKFKTRELASAALAEEVLRKLGQKLDAQGKVHFAVSGGSTPVRFLQHLSRSPLDWQNVVVHLTDERWVAASHVESNERMLHDTLKQRCAAAVEVAPIFRQDLSAEERCLELHSEFPDVGLATIVLGMGVDGHFGSLFADADNVEALLDIDEPRRYAAISTEASPHQRISMTLSTMLATDQLHLFFFGEEKLTVYEDAKSGNYAYPVAALLAQRRVPVNVYWAP